jgi:peptidoglycan/xylan/chitin deacetylase (PgdA/CDA1 family)
MSEQLARRWRPAPLVAASIALHGAAALAMLADPSIWRWALGGLLADHALLGALGMLPRSGLIGASINRLPAAAARRGEVALTFDDGPDPRHTPRVLALLAAHGARASFFCIGARAAAYPELVAEIVRCGHSVENHSYGHPYGFALHGPARLHREIALAQAAIAARAPVPAFFRAPMGLRNPLLDPVLAGAGLRHVAWTRRGLDTLPRADAAGVLRRLTDGLAAGDILLLHDAAGPWRGDAPPLALQVLPVLLDALAARGLRGVSLTQGLSAGRCRFNAAASAAASRASGADASSSAADCRAHSGNATRRPPLGADSAPAQGG